MKMQCRVTFFPATLLCALASCASAPAVPPRDLSAGLPMLAAEYITTKNKSAVRWHFFRHNNRIDIDNTTAHTGEVWQRDGKIVLMRQLFHDDRKGVEYQMDDFNVLDMKPSWQKQALLIDPQTLESLQETGSGWLAGHPARYYRGEVNGQQFTVQWLVDLNVPYSIERRHGDEKEVTQMQAVYLLAQSPWQYNNGDDYEIMDYTDLGDRERDPFVMRVHAQLPGGEMHHH